MAIKAQAKAKKKGARRRKAADGNKAAAADGSNALTADGSVAADDAASGNGVNKAGDDNK